MENKKDHRLIRGIYSFGVGMALGGATLMFDAYPFGFALLCAPVSLTLPAFFGLCAGALLRESSGSLLIAYTLTLVLRALVSLLAAKQLTLGDVSGRIFSEHVSARAVIASVGCFGLGFYRLWLSGFLYYDLFGVLISIFGSFVLTLLWSTLEKRDGNSVLLGVGLTSLCAAVLWSLWNVNMYGFRIGGVICAVLILGVLGSRGILFSSNKHASADTDSHPQPNIQGAALFVAQKQLNDIKADIKNFCTSLEELARLKGDAQNSGHGSCDIEKILSDICRTDSGLFAEVGEICAVEAGADRTAYERCVIDPCKMAAYLSRLSRLGESYELDRQLSDKLFDAVKDNFGDTVKGAYTYERDGRLAAAVYVQGGSAENDIDKICELAGDACGTLFMLSERVMGHDGEYIIFAQKNILNVSIAGKKRNARGEKEFCGDSFGFVKGGDGRGAVAFISDGMGSGRDAARVSGLCCAFLQRLVPTKCFDRELTEDAIGMLNGFLRSGSSRNECSTTLDLGELDLVSGRASFYKCGSAPTYVFRDGGIFKLRCASMPLGILEWADMGRADIELLPRDVIVMVSDGACETGEENGELAEYLGSRVLTYSPEQLADAVIEFSDKKGFADDVTAVVIKVEEALFERK